MSQTLVDDLNDLKTTHLSLNEEREQPSFSLHVVTMMKNFSETKQPCFTPNQLEFLINDQLLASLGKCYSNLLNRNLSNMSLVC